MTVVQFHCNLAVNPNAVVEVTPLVRTESDLQCIGETWDKAILERKKACVTLIALIDQPSHNILFRSASSNENYLPFSYKMFGSAWFEWE